MIGALPPKNPLDPNDYVIWEEQGFEWIWCGLFKQLVPKRKYIGFEIEQFIADNRRLGINVGMFNGQFFGTINFLITGLNKLYVPKNSKQRGSKTCK